MNRALLAGLVLLCGSAVGRSATLLPGMPPAAAVELEKLAQAGHVSLAALEIREIYEGGMQDTPDFFRVVVHPIWPFRAKSPQSTFAIDPARFRALGVPLEHAWEPEGETDPLNAPHKYLVFAGSNLAACYPVANNSVKTPWGVYPIGDFVNCIRKHGEPTEVREVQNALWTKTAGPESEEKSSKTAAAYPLVSRSGRWLFYERLTQRERTEGGAAPRMERTLWVRDLREGDEKLVCQSYVSRCRGLGADEIYYIERTDAFSGQHRLIRYAPDSAKTEVLFSGELGRAVFLATQADERPFSDRFLVIYCGAVGGGVEIITLESDGTIIARLRGRRVAETADGLGAILAEDGLVHVINEHGKVETCGRMWTFDLPEGTMGLPLLLPGGKQLGCNVHQCHASEGKHRPDGSRWEMKEAYIASLDKGDFERVMSSYERVTLRLQRSGPPLAHCWGLGGAKTDLFFAFVRDEDRPGYWRPPNEKSAPIGPSGLFTEPRFDSADGFNGWSVRGVVWGFEETAKARVAAVDPSGWWHYLRPPGSEGLDGPASMFYSAPVWIPGRLAFVATVGDCLWLCELTVR